MKCFSVACLRTASISNAGSLDPYQLSCLSLLPSSWCPLHLSCFQGPGSTIWCRPSSASSQAGQGPTLGGSHHMEEVERSQWENQVELHPKRHTQGGPSVVSQRHGHRGGLCLPGLVAACPGDPESEDEAQPPPVLRTVALLRPWLCHSSVYSGWCHLPLSRNSLPWLPFVAQLPEYGGDPRGPTPGESGEFGRRTELNTKGDTAEGRNNYLVQESILHLSSAV
ncbi:transmembrane protein 225B isoform X16 [Vulpes vulpes]|uniref:Transmembrane protein 225B isoform X16 n=1 Tax=Vulpes vulpes TaxID=9627 RepID=A0ABM5A354_VULVU